MNKKTPKQKIFRIRSLLVALIILVVLSTIISGFSLSVDSYNDRVRVAFSENSVEAQSVGELAQSYCLTKFNGGEPGSARYLPSPAGQACGSGYAAGFEGRPESQACSGISKKIDRANCAIAYRAGAAKKEAGGNRKGALESANDLTVDLGTTALCRDGKNQLARDACETGYKGALDGKSKEGVCGNARDKQACKAGFEGGEKAKEAAEEGPGGLADCDLTSNPLSWIVCPIIDLGANLTDFMFQNIINPLLSDVPISAERGDPVYKAWQGFRLIANLMLVVSMLMIVYAQTRGGGQ